MTDTEYKALMNLYHDYNEEFKALPQSILSSFYKRLYSKS